MVNDELRKIAREVAKEMLANQSPKDSTSVPLFSGDARTEVVRIESDADLEIFVRKLVALIENPKARRDIKLGKRRFRLRPRTSGAGDHQAEQAVTFTQGLVNERDVMKVADQTNTVVLGKKARMTPLARDAAKNAGISIIREDA